LQNALAEKAAWWAAMRYAGFALKVCSKLGLGAKPATPPTPLPHAPQNQLQLAECTCRKSCLKICMVGCDVLSDVCI